VAGAVQVAELDPVAVAARLQSADPPLILDVREDWERAAAHLHGTLDIPMAQVPARLGELPRERDIVVMCHGGVRSLQVAHFLVHNGFTRIANLRGGINAWAHEVDPGVGTY